MGWQAVLQDGNNSKNKIIKLIDILCILFNITILNDYPVAYYYGNY